jgi:glycosyltransferase involved in cell wall biosynthesis
MYESDVKKFDLILTNSKNTQKRLEHFVWEKSEILYPPVKLDEFKWIEQWDYYLSVSRLSSAKRIDNIVKAFKEMPDKKLVVIYGLNDPQKDEIFEIWKDCKNIEFVTCSWNEWFTDYIGNCIAWICVPINEDFWMVPIESMAAWKPVIWVDEGWIKETIINGETWVLIPSGWSIEDIKKATDYLTPEIALSMKSRSIERAWDFSYDEFAEKIKNFIK